MKKIEFPFYGKTGSVKSIIDKGDHYIVDKYAKNKYSKDVFAEELLEKNENNQKYIDSLIRSEVDNILSLSKDDPFMKELSIFKEKHKHTNFTHIKIINILFGTVGLIAAVLLITGHPLFMLLSVIPLITSLIGSTITSNMLEANKTLKNYNNVLKLKSKLDNDSIKLENKKSLGVHPNPITKNNAKKRVKIRDYQK